MLVCCCCDKWKRRSSDVLICVFKDLKDVSSKRWQHFFFFFHTRSLKRCDHCYTPPHMIHSSARMKAPSKCHAVVHMSQTTLLKMELLFGGNWIKTLSSFIMSNQRKQASHSAFSPQSVSRTNVWPFGPPASPNHSFSPKIFHVWVFCPPWPAVLFVLHETEAY